MGIIVKFILKNIQEKKFRTFLILLSVAVSSALFFASTAISGTIEQMHAQRIKKYVGNADLIIHANEKFPSRFFYVKKAESTQSKLEYQIGAIETTGSYKDRQETVSLDLKGFDLKDLQVMNPFVLEQESLLEPFQGKKMIISKMTAEKYHFQSGNKIEVTLNEATYHFIIAGIAQPVGLFQEDGRSNTAVVPLKLLAGLHQASGRVSIIYLKLKNPALMSKTIEDLSKVYRRYTVREPVSKQELRQHITRVTTPFILMVTLVLAMSIFIIYTSFKVITRERLPVIGTFRSIGATRRTTNLVLFAESVFYGIIGGVFGCAIGMVILYLMAILMTPQWLAGIKTTIHFSFLQLGAAFFLAVILAFCSSFVPIIRISKIPVKEIVLNSIEKPPRKKLIRLVLGMLFSVTAMGALLFTTRQLAFLIALVSMLMSITAVILLVPFLTAGFTKLFERVYVYLFGNVGVLAAKNLRENKSILNNISLLAIGISSLLMITTVSSSVAKEVINVYRDAEFDIWMGISEADRSFQRLLRTVDGVRDVYGLYASYNIEVSGSKEKIFGLRGINDQYFRYWNVTLSGNRRELLDQLNEGRNILLSNILKDKFGVKQGDLLSLRMKRGEKTYRIIGFFDSLMENGNYALISERYLKSDMMERWYANIFIKTSKAPLLVAQAIKKKFQRNRPWVMTMGEMEQRNMKSNANLFLILQGFSFMALVIGVIGVFNNLLISFIERKRPLAILRSVGMNKKQTIQMIFIESLSGGLIGGTVGVLAGVQLICLVPIVMKALDAPIPVRCSAMQIIYSIAGGVIISVIASISPAFKSSGLNVVDSLKYE